MPRLRLHNDSLIGRGGSTLASWRLGVIPSITTVGNERGQLLLHSLRKPYIHLHNVRHQVHVYVSRTHLTRRMSPKSHTC